MMRRRRKSGARRQSSRVVLLPLEDGMKVKEVVSQQRSSRASNLVRALSQTAVKCSPRDLLKSSSLKSF